MSTISHDAGIPIEQELEAHRRGLTGFCYRMLGSGFEAEDAVQETMVRAWRNVDSLDARPALKSWLYRIASNVCLDMQQGPQRRALAMDMGPASAADGPLGSPLTESAWVQPISDALVLAPEADPAEVADGRETLKLAFVAALQHLPPKQRAVLILREVLRWQATEVGELLDLSVASVNSALQRARATLSSLDLELGDGPSAVDEDQEDLLAKYVSAFESYDIASLVTLLRDDAKFSMPPLPLWLEGPAAAHDFMLGTGAKCRGSRVIPTRANGGIAAGIYNPTGEPGVWEPWAIVVLETEAGQITGLHHYIYPELFAAFGLPRRLGEDAVEPDELQQPA